MLWSKAAGAGGTLGDGGVAVSQYLGYCGDNVASGGAITVSGADLGTASASRLIVVAVMGSRGDDPNTVTVGGETATMVAGPNVTSGNFGQIWAAAPTGASGDIVVSGSPGDNFGFHWYAIYTQTPTVAYTVDDDASIISVDAFVYNGGVTIGAISTRADSTIDDVTMDASGEVLTYGPIISGLGSRFGFTWIALPTETAMPTTFNFSGVGQGGNEAIASWAP